LGSVAGNKEDWVPGAGHALPSGTTRRLAQSAGVNPDHIRLHDDKAANAKARALGAHAFTIGPNIVLARSVSPSSPGDDRLLAHEFAHVAQQERAGETRIHRQLDESFCIETTEPTIRLGSVDPAVNEAQCKLNAVNENSLAAGTQGLPGTPLAVDGIFGAKTREAVIGFQQQAFPTSPEEADGVIGPHTWTALNEALAKPGPAPSFCPVSPDGPATLTDQSGSTFVGGLPGFIPCDIPTVAGLPPLLKDISVDIPGPITAKASVTVIPHMHLGVKILGPTGENFTGNVTGGFGIGGEIFFSQVIRKSTRRYRMATDGSTDTLSDLLDGDRMYKTTTAAVGPGTTTINETDTPGSSNSLLDDASKPGRASIHIKDEFELFLMWRSDPADPPSKWLSYGSVNWSWDASATGVTATPPTKLPWVGPEEEFAPCKGAITSGGSLSIANRKPQPATHLNLPINQSGRVTPTPLTPTFPDAKALDPDMEKGC
jgi:peptidoglycan hydrolase-like protein with peptidoglycan-binding domain